MSRTGTISGAALIALALAISTPPAAADPDHPRCNTHTIQHRSDLPSGYSIRALQEGRNYPAWCR
jgi:hypothetical protein